MTIESAALTVAVCLGGGFDALRPKLPAIVSRVTPTLSRHLSRPKPAKLAAYPDISPQRIQANYPPIEPK